MNERIANGMMRLAYNGDGTWYFLERFESGVLCVNSVTSTNY